MYTVTIRLGISELNYTCSDFKHAILLKSMAQNDPATNVIRITDSEDFIIFFEER